MRLIIAPLSLSPAISLHFRRHAFRHFIAMRHYFHCFTPPRHFSHYIAAAIEPPLLTPLFSHCAAIEPLRHATLRLTLAAITPRCASIIRCRRWLPTRHAATPFCIIRCHAIYFAIDITHYAIISPLCAMPFLLPLIFTAAADTRQMPLRAFRHYMPAIIDYAPDSISCLLSIAFAPYIFIILRH